MFKKEHKVDWIVLIIIGISLIFLYGFNLREMLKVILTWGFALIGFRLLIEHNILNRINKNELKEVK